MPANSWWISRTSATARPPPPASSSSSPSSPCSSSRSGASMSRRVETRDERPLRGRPHRFLPAHRGDHLLRRLPLLLGDRLVAEERQRHLRGGVPSGESKP